METAIKLHKMLRKMWITIGRPIVTSEIKIEESAFVTFFLLTTKCSGVQRFVEMLKRSKLFFHNVENAAALMFETLAVPGNGALLGAVGKK